MTCGSTITSITRGDKEYHMEEIPGKETYGILRSRIVGILRGYDKGFNDEYPVRLSYRTAHGSPLAAYIDHTLLKQQAMAKDFAKLCAEAAEWKVHSVCVPSNRVELAKSELAGTSVKVCTVVGFPFGYANTSSKVEETTRAIHDGAEEIDMVLAVGAAKDADWTYVYRDIRAVVDAAGGILVKVILETSELSLEEKILGAYTACFAGAHYLKTSTGFASGGAQIDDINLLRHVAGSHIGVKASGGVRTNEFAKALIVAGADRLGSSGTAAVLGLGPSGGSKGY